MSAQAYLEAVADRPRSEVFGEMFLTASLPSSSIAKAEGRYRPLKRWLIPVALVALVLYCAFPFLIAHYAHFTSDDAIIGLMGKHLHEGRRLPLFFYGQDYMLGIEAYLAAILFSVLPVSTLTMKILMLGLHLTLVLLAYKILLEQDIPRFSAFVAAAMLALPSLIVSHRLYESMGGNPEPFIYLLLMWWVRKRRFSWMGITLGIGYLNRELTLIGFVALVVTDILWERPILATIWARAKAFALAFLIVRFIQTMNHKFYGYRGAPGSFLGDHLTLSGLWNNIQVILATHLSVVFNWSTVDIQPYNLKYNLPATTPWGSVVVLSALAFLILIAVGQSLTHGRKDPVRCSGRTAFYFMLSAVGSIAAFVISPFGPTEIMFVRYVLLSFLLLPGLYLWICSRGGPKVRAIATGCAALWLANSLFDHGRYNWLHVRSPLHDDFKVLENSILASGLNVGAGPYWTAFQLSFSSAERLVVTAPDYPRIDEYQNGFAQKIPEVFTVSEDPSPAPCPMPTHVVRWSVCFPGARSGN